MQIISRYNSGVSLCTVTANVSSVPQVVAVVAISGTKWRYLGCIKNIRCSHPHLILPQHYFLTIFLTFSLFFRSEEAPVRPERPSGGTLLSCRLQQLGCWLIDWPACWLRWTPSRRTASDHLMIARASSSTEWAKLMSC